jgi:putative ABC transport system permease protein
MLLKDLIRLAWANLLRNRTRSLMTLIGVMIGVAAMLSLLSYGAGLQHNARNEFNALELYNTLRVTSSPNPLDALGNPPASGHTSWLDTLPAVSLDDSLIREIEQIEGVLVAYPELNFPVELKANDREVVATAQAVPLVFGQLPSYRPSKGSFFQSLADSALLLSPSMAARLGFDPPADAVGRTVIVTTASLDIRALRIAAQAITMGVGTLPVRKNRYPVRVAGLLQEDDRAFTGFFRVLLPLDYARKLQKITFFSTLDLLLQSSNTGGYGAVRVQLTDIEAYAPVRRAIEAKGVYVTSFREQFNQLERLFLMMDLALGIIGFIALLVATIGIANTMMMNVIERYREIGIMKAVGGDESDLQRLFILESLTLGLLGGLSGLAVGWTITAAMNLAINRYLSGLGVPYLDVFHSPLWMELGILAVATLVSLLAGLAPARKAARIEPIEALRGV